MLAWFVLMNLVLLVSCLNGGGVDVGVGVGRVLCKVILFCGVWNIVWLCVEVFEDMGVVVFVWLVFGGGGGEGVVCCVMAWLVISKVLVFSRVI